MIFFKIIRDKKLIKKNYGKVFLSFSKQEWATHVLENSRKNDKSRQLREKTRRGDNTMEDCDERNLCDH